MGVDQHAAVLDRTLAARFPAVHEAQERQEALNVLAAGLGEEMGVTTATWPSGLWSVRCTATPEREPANQIAGVDPEQLEPIDEILPWFDEVGCAVRVRIPGPQLDEAQGRFLADRGFAALELEAWVGAMIEGLAPEARPHDLRIADTEEALEHFKQAFFGGWGIPGGRTQRIAGAAMGIYPGPETWRRYVAYVDGEPAGEAVLAMEGEIAYLAEAATIPSFRRRGVQRALIARRIEDARAAGAKVVFAGAQYGDPSWRNLRALCLEDAFMTVSFVRAPQPRH